MNFRKENSNVILTLCLSFAVSLMVSQISFGVVLFCVPLLLTCQKLKKTYQAVSVFAFLGICISLYMAFTYRESLSKGTNLATILLGMLFPLSSCIYCAIWEGLRNFSNNILRKFVICSYAAAILGVLFVIWISGPNGNTYIDEMVVAYSSIFPSEAFGNSTESVIRIVVSFIILMVVPFCMAFGEIQILVSEFIIHRTDDDWQYNFAYMKMPNSFVWVFLAVWIVALCSRFADFLPETVSIIAWNIAGWISFHYFLGGVSILTSFLRRHSATLTASRVFVPVLICTMIPGVNVVLLPGLVIIGVLETWIKFR